MNTQQLYLDLCTSWQSEPKYKEDVMLLLDSIGKNKIQDPEKILQVNVPVPQEYRLSACFNILFGGNVVFKTKIGAVQKLLEEIG